MTRTRVFRQGRRSDPGRAEPDAPRSTTSSATTIPSLIVEDLSGDDNAPAAAAEAAATPSFLGGRRIIVIREIGRFTANDVAPLIDYLAAPMDDAVVILGAGGGTVPAPLIKAVQKAGEVVDASTPRGKARSSWVMDHLQDAPVKVDAAAARLIESHLGEDIARLEPLVTILTAAFGPGAKLGPAQIAAVPR